MCRQTAGGGNICRIFQGGDSQTEGDSGRNQGAVCQCYAPDGQRGHYAIRAVRCESASIHPYGPDVFTMEPTFGDDVVPENVKLAVTPDEMDLFLQGWSRSSISVIVPVLQTP